MNGRQLAEVLLGEQIGTGQHIVKHAIEGKALGGELGAVFVPDIARQTAVTFVYQNKVVLLKAVNSNGLYLAVILELVDINDNDILALVTKSGVLLKQSR